MISPKTFCATLILGLGALWVTGASAQAGMGHGGMGNSGMGNGSAGNGGMNHTAMAGSQSDNAVMTEGEVRKVDLQAQTITLRHGAIKNLDMPGMTMAFKAKSADMLAKVKPGDKVRFHAEMPNGALTVTAIAVLK